MDEELYECVECERLVEEVFAPHGLCEACQEQYEAECEAEEREQNQYYNSTRL